MKKPQIASARLPLERARFFLGKAQSMTKVDRVELDHYLAAAVVFGRSAFHYLEKAAELTDDKAYRTWFGAKSADIKVDLLLQHFRDLRNTEIHAHRVPVARQVKVSLSANLRISSHVEHRITRAQLWYRRSPRIWWQDVRLALIRPVSRWRYQLGVSGWRIRAAIAGRLKRVSAQFRKPAKVTVTEFFLDDPEGLDRPAVMLVDDYLSRWELIVAEAEVQFPHVFG